MCQLLNDDPRNKAIVGMTPLMFEIEAAALVHYHGSTPLTHNRDIAGANRVVVYSNRKKSYYACFLGQYCAAHRGRDAFSCRHIQP